VNWKTNKKNMKKCQGDIRKEENFKKLPKLCILVTVEAKIFNFLLKELN